MATIASAKPLTGTDGNGQYLSMSDVNAIADTNPYKTYGSKAKVLVVAGLDKVDDVKASKDALQIKTDAGRVPEAVSSRFNPLYSFKVHDGILTDEDFAAKRADYEPTLDNLLKTDSDNAHVGLNYDPIDFMYAKDAENVSGYHMITLRRFPYPIDDMLMPLNATMPQQDICRLVGYTTEETNKLSDIMNMSFGLAWKDLQADFWTPAIYGSEYGGDGILGSVFKMMNPQYGTSKGAGKYGLNIDPMYDQNKVYGPIDVIKNTTIRDQGVNFSQEITLTFDYELKAYDGVNPKSAMIDLLSNILVMGTNDAMFWGGATKWVGIPETANHRYISVETARSMNRDYIATKDYYQKQLATLTGDGMKGLMEIGKALLNNLVGVAVDKLLDVIGRPTVVATNSMLKSDPTGLWHVTIGNPYRPILVMGNMILTSTAISFGDTLGHDGFPTTLRVACTLKHGKPRSRAEIEMMFNAGRMRTYWQPTSSELKSRLEKTYSYRGKSQSLLDNLTNEVFMYLKASDQAKAIDAKIKGTINR